MATASFNMQSVFAGGLTTRKINTNKLCFAGNFHNLKRNYPVGVRCMAEGEPMKDESAPSTSVSQPLPKSSSPPPPPPTKPKVSTKFSDLLAFSGPAPERINGRLAMVGFVAALAVELSKGENVLAQISDGGVSWFLRWAGDLGRLCRQAPFQGHNSRVQVQRFNDIDS
uniref:Uncharacterized protein n=1 Tax=Brassica oleracea TaxID=3712 RepID=A0A3P6B1J5_BRAOL|nr:unnamed protein product [Brassica oleracea]